MKRAVALSGGGTKGSYEVGVWRALKEQGIDYQIVTGTSIGSINGVFMASGEYERAFELWDTIKMENMMEDGINLTETIEGMLEQKDAIRPFLKKYVKNKGADISPFNEFIEKMVDEEALRNSEIDFGLVTTQFPSLKGIEMRKADMGKGMLKDYLLASSAIFPLFPMHKIGEDTYVDGCYYDNLPIDFAIKMGAEEVIAVDLRTNPAHPNYKKRPYVTYIKPTRSLGTMMNFDHELLMDNMQMGYQDAKKVFGTYSGFLYTFINTDFSEWKENIWEFTKQIAKAEATLSESRFGKIVKPGDVSRVFAELEAYTDERKLDRVDYFVRGAEIAAEIFGLDVRETYEFSAFIEKIKKAVPSRENCADVEIFCGKNKRGIIQKIAEWKLKSESAYITACIYHAFVEKQIDDMEEVGLLTLLPRELLAAAFLYAL